MLTPVLAHAGAPLEPHHLWGTWNLHPGLLSVLAVTVVLYARGRRAAPSSPSGTRRAVWFAGATLAGVCAVVSPLDAVSGMLASAHMVQHLLLLLVLAPLLVLSAPLGTLVRGMPARLHRPAGVIYRRLRRARTYLRHWRRPAPAWLLHAGVLWFWHAAVPYEAALRNHALHAFEHATFVATAVLFWAVVLGRRQAAPGASVLLVFAFALQNVFLAALLTFAPIPWYTSYAATAPVWGLTPLADQQLAGAIMWVPAGFFYTAVGLRLFALWLRTAEPPEVTAGREPAAPRFPPLP